MELRRGIIKAFDPATYTATVQVAGSLGNWLAGVPVAKHLAAGLLSPGSRCGVLLFDPTNPQDACLAFVYEGAPGAWVSDAMLEGSIAGSKVVAATTTSRGTVELAQSGEVATALAVQADDPRLADARVPTEHGADKHTNRTRSLYIPATDLEISAGAPAKVTVGTSPNSSVAWSFPDAAVSTLGTWIHIPEDWVSGTAFTVYFDWANDTDTTTGHACRWQIFWACLANGDVLTKAYQEGIGADVSVPAAVARTRARSQIGSSSAGLAAGTSMRLAIRRDGTYAGDTMTGAGLLLGVLIEYSADM